MLSLRTAIFSLFGFVAQSAAAATPLDLASDHGATVYLYYADGAKVVRVACPAGNPLHDRAVCSSGRTSVDLAALRTGLEADVGTDLSALQSQADLYYTKIERIDTQLLEQLQVSAGPIRDELAALDKQIKVEEAVVETQVATRNDLLDQVTRVEAQYRSAPDPDLAKQAQSLDAQIDGLGQQIDVAEAKLSGWRDQFIQAHATLLSGDIFTGLQAERAAAVKDLNAREAQLASSLASVAALRTLENMLLATSDEYDVISTVDAFGSLRPYATKLFKVYQQLLIADLTAQALTLEGQVSGADARASALRQQSAADLQLRAAVVSESRTPISQTLVIGVDASSANSPSGCTAAGAAAGHYVQQPQYSLWAATAAAAATGGDPDDAQIDAMIAALNASVDSNFSSWQSQTQCSDFMSSPPPPGLMIYADFEVESTFGSAGSRDCMTYTVASVERADDACPELLRVAFDWQSYTAKGGHAWAHSVQAQDGALQQQADQVEAAVAAARAQAAALRAQIEGLEAEASNI